MDTHFLNSCQLRSRRACRPGIPLAGGLLLVLAMLAGCDRSTTSAVESVPQGSPDYFVTASGMTLRQPAPGVLANDGAVTAGLQVRLAEPAQWGTVQLADDGSFIYEPSFRYYGRDSFSYVLVQDGRESEPVTVHIHHPNVVLILVDDMGLGDVSANNPRAPATPAIDRLAAEGMSFSHAHAPAAVCAPARYSVLTGNYPYRGRLSTGVWSAYEPSIMILPGQLTLGDLFSAAGYQTAYLGKLHIGGAFWNQAGTRYTRDPLQMDFSRPFDRGPTQYGFDYSFLLPGGVSGPPYAWFENDRLVRMDAGGAFKPFDQPAEAMARFSNVEQRWAAEFNGGLLGGPGLAMDNYDSRQTGPILTSKAIEFLGQAIDRKHASAVPEPFFLLFSPPQLHTPYTPAPEFALPDGIDGSASGEVVPVAGTTDGLRSDVIREIDLMVRAITTYLEARAELSNTLIIFTSDNGPLPDPEPAGLHPQGSEAGVPLRDSKGSIYEGGHRVPLLLRWGDGTRAGSVIPPAARSDALVGLQDLAATFLVATGQQRLPGQFNDSKSLMPVLTAAGNDPRQPWRDHLIVQGSPKSAADNRNYIDRAYYRVEPSGQRWKLIVRSAHTDPLAELSWGELYNLSADPGESRDLSRIPEFEAVYRSMQAEYLQRLAQPQTIQSFH